MSHIDEPRCKGVRLIGNHRDDDSQSGSDDGGLARNPTYEFTGISQRISLARLQTVVSTFGACILGSGNQIADSL
jgi:hypothetical protein